MSATLSHTFFTHTGGPLVLEVNNVVKPEYKEMTNEEFLATCYARLKKISEM